MSLQLLSVLVALVEVRGLSLHEVGEDLHVVGLHLRGEKIQDRVVSGSPQLIFYGEMLSNA